MHNRLRYPLLVLAVCIVALSAVVAPSSPGGAYDTAGGWDTNQGFISGLDFELRPHTVWLFGNAVTITPDAALVDMARVSWLRFGNTRRVDRVASATNYMRFATAWEVSGTNASATSHCRGNEASGCRIRINRERVWAATTNCTASAAAVDMVSTLTHELGHWYGSSHSTDKPSSSRNHYTGTVNTMHASSVSNCDKRTPEQDDFNVILHGERSTSQIASNDGFEWFQPGATFANGGHHWIFLPSTSGQGSAANYWDPGNAYTGNRFIQMNNGSSGTAASIYQDIHPRGAGVTVVTPNFRVRNDSGSNGFVKLVLWDLQHWTHDEKTCNLSTSSNYQYCAMSVNVNSNFLRLQIYNYTSGNISIDAFRMWAND